MGHFPLKALCNFSARNQRAAESEPSAAPRSGGWLNAGRAAGQRRSPTQSRPSPAALGGQPGCQATPGPRQASRALRPCPALPATLGLPAPRLRPLAWHRPSGKTPSPEGCPQPPRSPAGAPRPVEESAAPDPLPATWPRPPARSPARPRPGNRSARSASFFRDGEARPGGSGHGRGPALEAGAPSGCREFRGSGCSAAGKAAGTPRGRSASGAPGPAWAPPGQAPEDSGRSLSFSLSISL